jgi:hypothetical protein
VDAFRVGGLVKTLLGENQAPIIWPIIWEALGCAPLIVAGPELAAARALI